MVLRTLEEDAGRGIPFANYLFILCAQILAVMIRRNTYIKGIKIHNTGSKIVQYADNTELTLEDESAF